MIVHALLEHQYRRMMPRDTSGEITTAWWNVLRSWWIDDDLTTVLRGHDTVQHWAPTLALGDCRPLLGEYVHTRPLETGSRSEYPEETGSPIALVFALNVISRRVSYCTTGCP
ncbi:hypothetical protein Ddye_009299 [Dipteronia dyeriana]|uniref:Uncharacterized protein n=1 Tax=Dipteronia dyeriana TaxID=168575 RepID=A0AAE0CM46_9ROSI|nr:hypothetical protein Ddye_009299 [Dipteronia dyeriana]